MKQNRIIPGILFQEGEYLQFNNAGISHMWKIQIIFPSLGWMFVEIAKDNWIKLMIEDVNQRVQDGLMEVVK